MLRTCQCYGCEEPIPASRRKYCSNRCSNITRRDAYRARHPDRILAQARSYYERMPQAVYARHLMRNRTRRRAEASERDDAALRAMGIDPNRRFRFRVLAS